MERIINLIPPHEVYIEPFAGSAAIARHKRPAAKTVLVEKHDRAASNLACLDAEVVHGCGLEYLESYPFTGREFVYCDPPYVLSTRGGRRYYAHEWPDEMHVRFLRLMVRLSQKTKLMISGYPSELYAREGFGHGIGNRLPGWFCKSFLVMNRAHKWATECLWFNYPEPALLHDLSKVGDGWRERQRIARKRRRWGARLARMPDLERATLFAALVDAMGEEKVTAELARR